MNETYNNKLTRLTKTKHKPILIKVFDDIDLRNGHKGLSLIARKANIDLHNLPAGEFVVFINTSKTHIKLLANGNVMVHLKSGSSEQIEMKIIETLPRLFNGTDFDYTRSAQIGLRKVA